MNYLVGPFQDYLRNACRFHAETVAYCVDTLPQVFRNLQINQLADINAHRVEKALQNSRWEITPEGIQRVEGEQSEYLLVLRQFLQYLEDGGYPVERGLPSLVNLKKAPAVKMGGLTAEEQQQLLNFLRFNVRNDTQRRDTSLLFLLVSVGCTLQEALNLKVHKSGIIRADAPQAISGDFQWIGDQMYLRIKGSGKAYRKLPVPLETVNFLNFYLENRKHRSARLFIRNSGKQPLDAILLVSAKRFISKIFKELAIDVKPADIEEVLFNTALENTEVAATPLATANYNAA